MNVIGLEEGLYLDETNMEKNLEISKSLLELLNDHTVSKTNELL